MDAFPRFLNGDVDLALSPIRRLKLHSDVLRGASRLFEQLLLEEDAAVLCRKALKEGRNARFRVELVNIPTSSKGPGELVVMKLDSNGKIIDPQGSPRANMLFEGNGRDPSNGIMDIWSSVLGTLYGKEIEIDSDGLFTIIGQASMILDIMDYLQLKNAITSPIELALLSNDQTIWCAVNNDPIAWINLACRIRSHIIFREAAIHVIGGWNGWAPAQKDELLRETKELCARKAKKFEDCKQEMEERMLNYKPQKIRYSKDEPPKGKKLHEPDVIIWQAMYCFHNWLARRFHDGMGRVAADGGYSFYKMLHDGGDAYLTPEDQARACPALTPPGRGVFTQHIAEMKREMQNIVAPAMLNKLRLDTKKTPRNRLTPFIIDPHHCPWKIQEKEQQSDRQGYE